MLVLNNNRVLFRYMFFGDRCELGGGDWPLGNRIEYEYEHSFDKCIVHNVKNWKETWKILGELK